ncbi:succinate dehydrogenase, cytochrome b556 subunit [Mesorhizobium sp. A623]
MKPVSRKRTRPLSPNIQVYRPQLTSVLSIANRITGVALSACAVVLVFWLVAAARGPDAYSRFQIVLGSWPGRILLLAASFAFFLHLCGGLRHLVWDSVQAFELRQIYASGWIIVIASVALTLASWLISLMITGHI